ncbi:MAG TPA: hypothetical protein VFP60_02830 [Pseudolabrys sp.]|nr:hypothetical protein [Pseudolabrys sp.]
MDVQALTVEDGALSINGAGPPVDWLVVMKRLDERFMLDRLIAENRLQCSQLDRLVETLAKFYRHARPVFIPPARYLSEWAANLAYNRRILLDPRLQVPAGLVRRIDIAQQVFLSKRSHQIKRRLLHRRIVDGHGDLRLEHIWLNEQVTIIDCLEFNPRLRVVDPFDEVAFLSLECDRLGAGRANTFSLV